MLIIKINKNDNIDVALKRFKIKFRKTKVIEQIRKNMEFKKPSVRKREQKQKAIYKNKLNLD